MVQRNIKIPKHGGPDGQGLSVEVFDVLISMLVSPNVSQDDAQQMIELVFSISKEDEWNNNFRPILIELLENNNKQ